MTRVATRQRSPAACSTWTIGADRSRCTRLAPRCVYRKYRKLQHIEIIGVSASIRASNPIFRKTLPATCNGASLAGEARRRPGVQGPDWREHAGDTGCSRPPAPTEVACGLPSPSRNIYRKYRKIQLLEIQGVLSAEEAPTRIFRKRLPRRPPPKPVRPKNLTSTADRHTQPMTNQLSAVCLSQHRGAVQTASSGNTVNSEGPKTQIEWAPDASRRMGLASFR
jgi:hypothetical protein